MTQIKINSDLSSGYQVTDKVRAAKFEHRYLGVVDLEKIGPVMAEKLVGTGHLSRVKTRKEDPVKKDKS